jgi:uncharacterized protein
MIFIDSGYFIALFNPADQLHACAVACAGRLQESLLVTEYVLWECVNYFAKPEYRHIASAIIQHVEADPGCELIPASHELFRAGMGLFSSRADKAWSLTDCISFHVMHERRITQALAYDEHFEQAGFKALLREEI